MDFLDEKAYYWTIFRFFIDCMKKYVKLYYFCKKIKHNKCMKPKNVLPFNWRRELENVEVHTIGNDIVLLDRPVITSTFKYPFKVDVNTNIISISGSTEGVKIGRASCRERV